MEKWAVNRAVDWAMRDAGYWTVNRAVNGAVSLAVDQAVDRAGYWPVGRAVWGAVNDAVYDPGQPTLRDFLQEAK